MLERIDRSRYVHCPNGNGRQLMSLARTLRARTPAQAGPAVLAAAAELDAALDRTQAAYAERLRGGGAGAAALDREDDGYADAVLKLTRIRLEDWQIYTRPSAARVAETEARAGVGEAFELARFRARAAASPTAARTRNRLLNRPAFVHQSQNDGGCANSEPELQIASLK